MKRTRKTIAPTYTDVLRHNTFYRALDDAADMLRDAADYAGASGLMPGDERIAAVLDRLADQAAMCAELTREENAEILKAYFAPHSAPPQKEKTADYQRFRNKFVIRTGLEPVTGRLEICCSIQLSYRTVPPSTEGGAKIESFCRFAKFSVDFSTVPA